ncbi:MAG: S26 family signal peptidase [Oligoflexia bacterium]|nr:S26 family signal peptidase [Oligoflexia bacterium]
MTNSQNDGHGHGNHPHNMQDKKTFRILIGVIVLLVGSAILYKYLRDGGLGFNVNKTGENACVKEVKTVEMRDDNIKGIIDKGQKIKVAMGWYECNPIKKGDLAVFYRPGLLDVPYVKVVRGAPGEKFSVKPDSSKKGWNVYINGDAISYNGRAFVFGDIREEPALRRYEVVRNGVLRDNEAILMSTVPPGDFDSTTTGLHFSGGLIGKVIEIAGQETDETEESKDAEVKDDARKPAEEKTEVTETEAENSVTESK